VLASVAALITLGACSAASTPSTASTPPTAASSAATSPTGSSPVPTQSAVPVENNPPGDIPDNTVYVAYRSKPGAFAINVPEGWARKSATSAVTFSSALNSIDVAWGRASSAPTVASTKRTVVPMLASTTLAFQPISVTAVSLQGGPAVETLYQVNSAPNAVTGKQYRLVIERFELYRSGRTAVLSLSSAVGSDNVDPWRIVSESFRWN
jgi:hypothetical protein